MNIKIRESKKMIVNVNYYESSAIYKISFVDWRKTWKTYQDKSWNTRDELEQVIKFVFIEPSALGSDLAKKSPTEICQELKGKSVVITTSITDK